MEGLQHFLAVSSTHTGSIPPYPLHWFFRMWVRVWVKKSEGTGAFLRQFYKRPQNLRRYTKKSGLRFCQLLIEFIKGHLPGSALIAFFFRGSTSGVERIGTDFLRLNPVTRKKQPFLFPVIAIKRSSPLTFSQVSIAFCRMIPASKTSSAPARDNGNPSIIICPAPAQAGRLPSLFGDWFGNIL